MGKIWICTGCWANPSAESHREWQMEPYRVHTCRSPTSHLPTAEALSHCPALSTSRGECPGGNPQGSAAALHPKSPRQRRSPPAASHSLTMGTLSQDAPLLPKVMWHVLTREQIPYRAGFTSNVGGEMDARDGAGKQTPSLPEGLGWLWDMRCLCSERSSCPPLQPLTPQIEIKKHEVQIRPQLWESNLSESRNLPALESDKHTGWGLLAHSEWRAPFLLPPATRHESCRQQQRERV